jgi:hypothetical protein
MNEKSVRPFKYSENMKKVMFLLAIALMLLSCNNSLESTSMKVINLSANTSDWKMNLDNDGLNRYYSCSFTVPEINTLVYSSGSVQSYIKIGSVQQTLPYVRHYENTNGNLWTRTVDFEYTTGKVTYFVTNSDFVSDPPQAMDFRLVLTW